MTLSSFKNRTGLLALLLILVAVAYGVFELLAAQTNLSDEKQDEIALEAVQKAAQSFIDFEDAFFQDSQEFSSLLRRQITDSLDRQEIYTHAAANNFDFWGFTVFKNQDLWLWDGFGENNIPINEADTTAFVTIRQSNNVIFLQFVKKFKLERADRTDAYIVSTRKKIQQNNILPINRGNQQEPGPLFYDTKEFPVHFNFFQAPPENPETLIKLHTQRIDSAGTVYTLAKDYGEYRQNLRNSYFLYRAVFFALIMVILTLFLIEIAKNFNNWKSLFLKLFAITTAWLFFANLEYGIGWIGIMQALGQDRMPDIRPLLFYGIHAFFILLLALTSYHPLMNSPLKFRKQEPVLLQIIPGVFGVLSFLLLFFFLSETYQLFRNNSIAILDLDLIPTTPALLFYFFSSLLAFSSMLILSVFGRFILRASPLFLVNSYLWMGGTFLGAFMITWIFSDFIQNEPWIFATSSLFYLIILGLIYVLQKDPNLFSYTSQLRTMLLFSSLAVCIIYVSIYKGYSGYLNQQMKEAAGLLMNDEEAQAEFIAQNLLIELEQALSGLTEEEIDEQPSLVENIFIQQTRQRIRPEWESYSISTQLVDNTGQIIGDFTSDLNSPAWTRDFNLFSLVVPFEEERIRRANLRPIIRDRPLNESRSNYSSFRRAWIPLYGPDNSNQRIGWILCSVYRERPQFGKPLRAVLAAKGETDLNVTIAVTEFVDGRANRNTVAGTPLDLPGYSRLPQEIEQKVQQDSAFYQSTELGGETYKEFYQAISPDRIIRAATPLHKAENHLFSLARYFFFMLATGLLFLSLFLGYEGIQILGHNRRFRDRLIDRFILASLLCLIALNIATYYALKNQNQRSIKSELLDKLENLSEAISSDFEPGSSEDTIELAQFTSALDADAAIYTGKSIQSSTTNQIFQQQVLPELIPWNIYRDLIETGNHQTTQTVTLGKEQLLIGYQVFNNMQGEMAGIVAIPTFLDAPKFNEQLLSTTSYLLVFYVLIFGLFIVAAALISTRLTAPLEALREGLKKIADGNLETTLPVRSNDEIGSLTNAYNVMVYRLKDLREELARAEREAAWKEMAQQVAHEIKNPLTPMKLNLQHLQRQLKATGDDLSKARPNIKKVTANMIEQIESLNQIASDFSKFAKPVDQDFEPVEINQLLHSVSDLYEAERKLIIQKELHPEDIWVQGVKDELRRVLINLVKNAFEAMPKSGGNITLTSRFNEDQTMVIISVSDDGEGIPNKHQRRIFVPNFSTKSSGTGLGLAISKKIIEAHDGTISLESTPGEGTTFTIAMPVDNQR